MGAESTGPFLRTLIGHQQMAVGLRCLPSLARYSCEAIRLVIHDDGTLTSEDVAALREAVGPFTFVSRTEADDRVEPLLGRHPGCAAYRRQSSLGLKLFDGPLLADGGDTAFCDSDVLFVRPFTGLFQWPDPAAGCLLMRDSREAYSLRPWHVYPFGSLRPVSRGNTGVMLLRGGRFDLDLIEYVLTRDNLRAVSSRRPYWVEQTCLAVLAGRIGGWWYDPRQLIMADPGLTRLNPDTIAVHFVGTFRGELDRYVPPADDPTAPPVAIRVRPASRAGPIRLLVSDIRKPA